MSDSDGYISDESMEDGITFDQDDTDDVIDEKIRSLLTKAIREQKIPEQKLQNYIEKFLTLHKAYKSTESRESEYLEKSQALYKELMQQKERLKELGKEKQQLHQFMSDLRREMTKAEHQLALVQEKGNENQMLITEKEQEISEMENQVKSNKQAREDREKPLVEGYQKEIARLKKEIEHFGKNFEKHKNEREGIIEKITILEHDLDELDEEEVAFRDEADYIKEEPERAQKQLDIVKRALFNAQSDLEKKNDEIHEMKSLIEDQINQESQLEQSKNNLISLGEHGLKKIIGKDKEIKQQKIKLQQEITKTNQHLANCRALQQEVERKKAYLGKETENFKIQAKNVDTHIKDIQKLQSQIRVLDRNMKRLIQKKSEKLDARKLLTDRIEKTKKEISELDREVDLRIHDFLNDETVHKMVRDKVVEKANEVKQLEEKINELGEAEKQTEKLIAEYSQERERVAREATLAKQKFVDTMGEVKVVTFVNAELRKNWAEIEEQNRILQKKYSLMKQNRNKLAQSIQENLQVLTQISENKKVLENEHQILSKNSLRKEKDLIKLNRTYDEIAAEREKLRKDISKHQLQLNKINDAIGESNNEIAKLNSVITLTEDEMLSLKSQYENRVQDRNYTGIQLIDRNDELCILYEKSNIQEGIIKNGEVELRKRKKEVDLLIVELESVQRELAVIYKKLPDLKALLKEKATLELQIEQNREISEEYSRHLEDPKNEERWRKLGGHVPELEDLQKEVQEVQEKLNAKKELLMEKNLVLQEITKSSDKLRKLAISGRDHTFDLAVGVNQIQAKIREENRKMMATLSELSVYQATSMTMEARNKQLQIHIDKCEKRMEKNLPPSKRMQWEWRKEAEMMERRKEQLQHRKEEMEMIKELPATITRTTAVQRPNSYIPDDALGLPVPYTSKPMMYPGPSANMRHYRKPKQLKVEL